MAVRLPEIRKGKAWHQFSAAEWENLVRVVRRFDELEAALPLILDYVGGRAQIRLEAPFVKRAGAVAAAVQQFRITDPNFPDTVKAEPWNGTMNTDEAIHIARPPNLRVNSIVQNGIWNALGIRLFITKVTNFSVIARHDPALEISYAEAWVILDLWRIGTIIYAASPIGGTGVTIDGEDVKWIDCNLDARHWMFVGTIPTSPFYVRSQFVTPGTVT